MLLAKLVGKLFKQANNVIVHFVAYSYILQCKENCSVYCRSGVSISHILFGSLC